jgi:BirA family biotin operon repressor/biotin-[acetyl-CoA-carboxylase] ligase
MTSGTRSLNAGYFDALPPELADALRRAHPRLGRLASTVRYFATLGSTNDEASAVAADDDAEGAVVIAEAQTAGRGRRGRTWFSPPSAGLYVSVVLSPARAPDAPDRATRLVTLAAGVALAEGIQRATGLRPDIKWPNDMLVGRRKVGGILAEGAQSRSGEMRVVLGYGINIWPAAFPPEIAARATSLESELGRPVDRIGLCVETLTSLASRYDDLVGERYDAILDAWRAYAPSCEGARVSWKGIAEPQTGITTGIDGAGALLVRVGDPPGGIVRIVAGEVTWS